MMKILGIIAEYNPFHNGHLHHVQKSVEKIKPDFIIAIMSGHFTQRGEPAIIDKWARTKMALENGVDLVLELPVAYACQTAELFAFGGIQVLNQTGLVTHVAFGSEFSNIGILYAIAEILVKEPCEYRTLLKSNLAKGLSFPHARSNAIKEYISHPNKNLGFSTEAMDEALVGSNTILALEYLKALIKTHSTIEPVIIPRMGSDYNCPNIEGQFSSATAIRNKLLSHADLQQLAHTIPPPSLEILDKALRKGRGPVTLNSLEQIILGIIRRSTPQEIHLWMDVEEGLENRIKEYGKCSISIDDFLTGIQTRRYVGTRLQRIIIHGILGITSEQVSKFQNSGGPKYLRILGFNSKSTPLLAKMKKTAQVPIISKAADYYRHSSSELNEMFELDVLATDLYCLGFPNIAHRTGGQEFTQNIVIL